MLDEFFFLRLPFALCRKGVGMNISTCATRPAIDGKNILNSGNRILMKGERERGATVQRKSKLFSIIMCSLNEFKKNMKAIHYPILNSVLRIPNSFCTFFALSLSLSLLSIFFWALWMLLLLLLPLRFTFRLYVCVNLYRALSLLICISAHFR